MAFVDLVKEAKSHRHMLLLWPQRWKLYSPFVSLSWEVFPFDEGTLDQIPDGPGVYAFLIQPRIASNLSASYPMYVGQTERSLQKRFREYLREAEDPTGRPKINMLLQLYKDFIYFSCAVLPSSASLDDVEEELLKALVPPANSQFPAEVSKVVRAF